MQLCSDEAAKATPADLESFMDISSSFIKMLALGSTTSFWYDVLSGRKTHYHMTVKLFYFLLNFLFIFIIFIFIFK